MAFWQIVINSNGSIVANYFVKVFWFLVVENGNNNMRSSGECHQDNPFNQQYQVHIPPDLLLGFPLC